MSDQVWPLGLVVPLQMPTPFSPFVPTQWREALHEIACAGYEGVEFAIVNPNDLDRMALMGVLKKEGLRLLAIATGQAVKEEGLSLSSTHERTRELAVQRVKDHMRLAKEFGAMVIVGTLYGSDGDKKLLVESLRECVSFDSSVKVTLEAINRYESSLANTVFEVLDIIEQIGAENLGVQLDTFHANIEERNIREAIQLAGKKLFHVDLADSNRWVPGYGHLNLNEVWEALDSIGYEGHIVIECFPKPSQEALLNACNRLRQQWNREKR